MADNKRKIVQEANIRYHTKLAKNYDKTQPHFRSENQEQVRELIKKYAEKTHGKRLLDLGCGTGFILSLAHPYFEELYGVDITSAMLKLATSKFKKKRINNIKLIRASTDDLPFSDSYFDVITGYSFIHHLSSLFPTLKEVYRVLKNGGIFYSDLDPNYYFWNSIKSLSKEKNVSDLLKIDINSICNMVKDVQNIAGGLDSETIKKAEYVESSKGGFKGEVIKEALYKVGFKKVNLEYHWFWQEGKVIKDLSLNEALYFENHLRYALPLTRWFFKYIRMDAIK